jgi:glyoxylase-like metal-dependent hydrolase (beta-lactamase superfamily II)
MSPCTRLARDLYVHHGAVNVGILLDGRRALLIDCGNGDVGSTLQCMGVDVVEQVVFTHHHRDQASGFCKIAAPATRVGVPAGEAALFCDVQRLWNDPDQRWHLYDARPSLLLATPIPVHERYVDGDSFAWGRSSVSVLETPGHTDGAVSYLVMTPGEQGGQRFLFTGDVIYGDGQVWDLYSLQKGVGTRDYHGFMGDRVRLEQSLRRMLALGAAVWVPSHGHVLTDPAQSAALLIERLDSCYEQYAAIAALRYYFPDLFREYGHIPGSLAYNDGLPIPGYLKHLGTTWVVCSEAGPAFAIDCGTEQVVQELEMMRSRGEIGRLEWLWVTHYHDDHVDAIPAFVRQFACPVVAEDHVAQVIEHPLAWRLPCISPARVRVDRVVAHGETWTWHEFSITAFHLPGQTLYHGGLLLEGRGHRILFAGDSFTMAGIDDYCTGNRNWLGTGVGFDACLALVEATAPDLIVNNHVDRAFRFSASACQLMRDNLAARERSFGELVAWDHPNYGLDEHWIRCYPYEQHAAPGAQARLSVVFTNHSSKERSLSCYLVLPVGWDGERRECTVGIPPKAEGAVDFRVEVAADARPGRWIIPVEVAYGGHPLGQFREAVIVVGDGGG